MSACYLELNFPAHIEEIVKTFHDNERNFHLRMSNVITFRLGHNCLKGSQIFLPLMYKSLYIYKKKH